MIVQPETLLRLPHLSTWLCSAAGKRSDIVFGKLIRCASFRPGGLGGRLCLPSGGCALTACRARPGTDHSANQNIEGAAAFEIEAGVVPMTGQDAVLDAAALEREAHVRHRLSRAKTRPPVGHDKDRTMPAVENEPALRLQLIKTAREHEFPAWAVHQHAPAVTSTLGVGIST